MPCAARSATLARDRAAAHDRRAGRTAGQPRPGLELLARSARSAPPGTFVFVLSDFLPPPSATRLTNALAAGWDVIPVVVQDPVWERSFPDVPGVTLPLADPDDGTPSLVRLNRAEARARRELNEQRASALDQALRDFELDPVHDHEQRPTGGAQCVSRVGGAAARPVARLSVSEAGRLAEAVRDAPGARLLAVVADPRRVDRGGGRRRPARPPELHRVPRWTSRSP